MATAVDKVTSKSCYFDDGEESFTENDFFCSVTLDALSYVGNE